MTKILVSVLVLTFAVSVMAFGLRFEGNVAAMTDCDMCKANLTKLVTFLAGDMGVKATVESFNRDLCPYYSNDTKGCQKNVTATWPLMAKALFGTALTDTVMAGCQGMGHCNKTTELIARDAMCDSCTAFVKEVSKNTQTNTTAVMTTTFFQGPDFCSAAKPPMPMADCKTFAGWFTPKAMMVLGQAIGLADNALCKVVFNTCK